MIGECEHSASVAFDQALDDHRGYDFTENTGAAPIGAAGDTEQQQRSRTGRLAAIKDSDARVIKRRSLNNRNTDDGVIATIDQPPHWHFLKRGCAASPTRYPTRGSRP